MSAPTDELPAIETSDPPSTWRPTLVCSKGIQATLGPYIRGMILPDLIALVIALPDDEQALALTEALSERFAKTGRADDWWANVLEDKSKRVESLTAELGAVRAELEALRAFIRDHGEVLTGALSSTADAAEGGLFPEHVKRLDAAHSALAKLRGRSPPASQGVCGTCGGDGFVMVLGSNNAMVKGGSHSKKCSECGGSGCSPEEKP